MMCLLRQRRNVWAIEENCSENENLYSNSNLLAVVGTVESLYLNSNLSVILENYDENLYSSWWTRMVTLVLPPQ